MPGFPGGSVVKNSPDSAETQVWPLIQEEPTCHRELSLCTTTTEPMLLSPGTKLPGPRTQLLKPTCSSARGPQQESYHTQKPAHATREQRPLTATRGKPGQQQRYSAAKKEEPPRCHTLCWGTKHTYQREWDWLYPQWGRRARRAERSYGALLVTPKLTSDLGLPGYKQDAMLFLWYHTDKSRYNLPMSLRFM